jgi:predicted O-methyltransferase YrrM
MAIHLAEESAQLGSNTSTDLDESFNKTAKRIYKSAPYIGVKRVLTKYWLYLHAAELVQPVS